MPQNRRPRCGRGRQEATDHMRVPFYRDHRWSRGFATTAAAAMAAFAIAGVPTTSAAAPAAVADAVNVTVNADEGLGTVPATAYGANQAVWDTNMNTPASVSLLSQAHVGMMRYPGGSYGDGYHWQTNTVSG